jgi:hypothetical protein
MAASPEYPSPFDPKRRGWFVVLGIAPGLGAVGYCVLDIDAHGVGHCLDYDVLMGNRAAQLDRANADLSLAVNVAQLISRFRVHRMIIEVLCERHYPFALAIGPAALSREPPLYVSAARSALADMARVFGLHVVDVSKQSLRRAFPGEKLPGLVQERLASPIGSNDRRVLRAAGAALVAAHEVRSEKLSLPAGV